MQVEECCQDDNLDSADLWEHFYGRRQLCSRDRVHLSRPTSYLGRQGGSEVSLGSP